MRYNEETSADTVSEYVIKSRGGDEHGDEHEEGAKQCVNYLDTLEAFGGSRLVFTGKAHENTYVDDVNDTRALYLDYSAL